jgi:uncharacterized protein (TIGR04255 family)
MVRASAFQFDLKKKFFHLPSAPIAEAVIHWRARATNPWQQDPVREQLTARLSNYPKCEPIRELQIHAEIDTEGAKTQTRRESFLGYRLTSADNLYIAQFTRDGLVFSRLKPYSEWESFSKEALRLWQFFLDLADPSEVQRLGVRFINQIPVKQVSDIGKILKRPPKCLDALGLPLSGFFYQSIHDVPDHPYGIRVAQTIQPPSPPDSEEFQFILDIDVFTEGAFEVKEEILREHLPRMRLLKDEAFFGLLKPKAIDAFKTEHQ